MDIDFFQILLFVYFLESAFPLKVGYLKAAHVRDNIIENCSIGKNIELFTERACEDFDGLDAAVTLEHTENVDLFLAEGCESEAETISRLVERWGKLFITAQSLAPNDKGKTTLVATRNTTFGLGRALAVTALHLNWTHLTTPTSTQEIIKRSIYKYNVQSFSSLSDSLQLCEILSSGYSSMESFVNQSFHGELSHFFVSSSGILLPDWELHFFDGSNETLVAKISGNNTWSWSFTEKLIALEMVLEDCGREWIFQLPPAIPLCGFDGLSCSNRLIYLAVAAILFVLSVPLSLAWYFQKKEHELQKMSWRIGHNQVRFNGSNDLGSSAASEKLRLSSFRTNSLACSTFGSLGESCKIAQVFGKKVTVKSYFQRRPVDISRKDMEHLNELHSLTHSNINSFVGISFDSGTELLVLWTFCTRHSLEDLFFIKEHKLGRNFLASFLRQILRGLHHIHNSPLRCHGALFLSNCVVDSYWVVKLTDFGIRPFIKEKVKQKDLFELPILVNELPRKFLQHSPEFLSELLAMNELPIGNHQTDIYQMGMIIYQILFRQIPFSEYRHPMEEVIKKIIDQKDSKATIPLRPKVPEETEYTLRLRSIMQQCWIGKAAQRPTLSKIQDALFREFGAESKGTLMDSMIAMVDEYSNHLEEIVEQRTEEIQSLQKRTEHLLYQLLPRTVADQLREGRPVPPQLHQAVSLLAVDVCDFTTLCENSTPLQIIEMLNRLYGKFDCFVEKYQAFKVENVGDAYLLISGIPKVDHYQHLVEVCRLALKFREFALNDYKIPHHPEKKLRLKMGINSGPLASGILGIAAPRFCVFGDTVNLTFRMAATCEPDKIQVNEITARIILEKFSSEFHLEERGVVDIKGKGKQTTFYIK
ncbi:unnamed protein product, partial [Mesorhabditis belari]|uniref:guanylate cyclase n=1 Tax=Mesorhabditis belari TaxID=2138241 RepID=A0AAF3EXB2_9BILA